MEKYNKKKIDPELRNEGLFGKSLPFIFSSKVILKLTNKLLHRSLQGKCREKSITMEERWIIRKDGKKLRICIYRPVKEIEEPLPGLLWIHGGGYATGMPEMDENFIKNFMQTVDCIVVSPDYRLSIEEPYPAALDDCYAALLWMKHNADKLGVRSNQLMVGGDSAGGGLTAALTLYVRDKGNVNVAFQMPLYPMIDDRMTTESSKGNYVPVWNSDLNYKGWKYYLGNRFQTEDVPKYAAPARETDYSNLPPTCTFVGELEVFRDEATIYMEKLKEAGVDTYFKEYPACYHGFDQLVLESRVAKDATKFLLDTFRYATEHYFAEQPESKKQHMEE